MRLPVPITELAAQIDFDAPALAVAESGIDDIRHDHPCAGGGYPAVYLRHRAEVHIGVSESLLHALADGNTADGNGGLSADDELDLIAAQLQALEYGSAVRDLYLADHLAVRADAEIQGVLTVVDTAECTHFDRGIDHEHIDGLVRQAQTEPLRAGKVDARVGFSLVSALLSVQPKGIAEAVDDLGRIARADNPDIGGRERNLARADHDVARALNKMQVSAGQRAAQLERRNGEIIAVYGRGEVLEARAAAVQLTDGHRRDEHDAGACLDVEPQVVRNQAAVLFAARERQLGFGFEQVKGVQLKAECIALLALEGVDLALDRGELESQHSGSVEAAGGVYAVDLEFIGLFAVHGLFLQAVAQLFERELGAVKKGLEPDVAGKNEVSVRIGGNVLQLGRGIGNIDIDHSLVLRRGDAERKAVLGERNRQAVLRAALRLVELEGRRVQADTVLHDCAVAANDEAAAAAPCGRHGRREQRRAAGKLEGRTVDTLAAAADDGGRSSAVLLFQSLERGIVRDVLDRHAVTAGKRRKALSGKGGIHLVRQGRDGFAIHLSQIAEAPEKRLGVGR